MLIDGAVAPIHPVPAGAGPFFVPSRTGNVQINRITKHFGSLDASAVRFPPRLRLVFMCFTQRCGSTYLAQLIGSSRRFNQPRETLNYEHVIQRSTRRRLADLGHYLSDLMRCDARRGLLFIKVTPLHLGLLAEAGVLAEMMSRGEFILIERGDKLSQAISYVIARETGKYTSNMQARKATEELVYNRDAISRTVISLTESYRQFDLFFGMNGITPVHVVYEQLLADTPGTLRRISDRLGLPEFLINKDNIRNARQSSDVNADWRRRFLQGEGAAAAEAGLPRPTPAREAQAAAPA